MDELSFYVVPAILTCIYTAIVVTSVCVDSKSVAWGAVGMVLLLGASCINPVSLLTSVGFLGLLMAQAVFHLSPRVFSRLAILLAMSVLGWHVQSTRQQMVEVRTAQAEYPVTSLVSRLEYEGTRQAGSRLDWYEDQPEEIRQGIQDFMYHRADRGRTDRDLMLMYLHDDAYWHFVNAIGFGIACVPRPRLDVVMLPKAEPIKLLCERPGDLYPSTLPAPPPLTELKSFHWGSAAGFLDYNRMGLISDVTLTVGFEPHAFMEPPPILSNEQTARWQITDLQLVSLLKHKAACVYESEFLPNMEELSGDNVPTRPLDEFEASALPQLRTERDIVIDTEIEPGKIRMLGSLRALGDCTKCHSVNRGDLLGAFSYRLVSVGRVSTDQSASEMVSGQ